MPHATWFSLMGIGGGVFLLSRLLGLATRLGTWLGMPVDDLLSFTAIAVGGLILIHDLGRPFRFVWAVLRPGTSWISRGAVADFVFLVVGGLLVLPDLALGDWVPFVALPWDAAASTPAGRTIEAIALLSAAVVIYYAGQVLADSPAIPYWTSTAVPLQFVLSSLATSLGIVMALQALNGVSIGAGQCWLLAGFLAGLLATIGWHLRSDAGKPGKAESLEILLRGRFRGPFLGGVVVAGTLVPLFLAALAVAIPTLRPLAGTLTLAFTLPGGFALRLLTLRAGIYPAVRASVRLPAA